MQSRHFSRIAFRGRRTGRPIVMFRMSGLPPCRIFPPGAFRRACSSRFRRVSAVGRLPNRHGQREQSVEGQRRISFAESQQQRKQYPRIALSTLPLLIVSPRACFGDAEIPSRPAIKKARRPDYLQSAGLDYSNAPRLARGLDHSNAQFHRTESRSLRPTPQL